MDEQYVPTTDEVRSWYMETWSGPDGRRGLAFDRWLAERDAATAELEAQLANAKAGWESALRIVNEGNEIIKQVGADRDAAVAAIERVRAIAERHGVKSWTEEIFAALDGAPEPEVKP